MPKVKQPYLLMAKQKRVFLLFQKTPYALCVMRVDFLTAVFSFVFSRELLMIVHNHHYFKSSCRRHGKRISNKEYFLDEVI